MTCPCKECLTHSPTCHGSCEKYKAYDDENKKRREFLRNCNQTDRFSWVVRQGRYKKNKRKLT